MKKIVLTMLFIFSFIFPNLVLAQSSINNNSNNNDEIFQAKVIKIIKQDREKRENGTESIKQKLRLVGLSGSMAGKEFIFEQGDYDVLSSAYYKVGDKVVVNKSYNFENKEVFYIVDRVRSNSLFWLALIFSITVIFTGGLKGFRALVVLFFTFVIILKFIIPQILTGANPLFITIVGSLFILLLSIYITEGFKWTSHISILSIILALIITGGLSVLFTNLARINGFVSEDIMFLVSSKFGAVDVKGILLSGIIIGSLGVLDDVVIAQVMTVEQLFKVNSSLSKKDVYFKAMKVGVSHISSMINTLFLAYAGASLPLLLLFSIHEPPFLGFSQIINNEMVAVEIVRALTGSIGLVLAVPIATALAVIFVVKDLTKK